jgi:hypothetical protein
VDEAHHLLPSSWNPASLTLPQNIDGLMLITVHPDQVAPAALSLVDAILTVGNLPEQNIEQFCKVVGYCPPQLTPQTLEPGEVYAWFREAIKDESLAEEVENIEQTANGSASKSRAAIKAAIEQRYTLPA